LQLHPPFSYFSLGEGPTGGCTAGGGPQGRGKEDDDTGEVGEDGSAASPWRCGEARRRQRGGVGK
jgi:hypothetical protein